MNKTTFLIVLYSLLLAAGSAFAAGKEYTIGKGDSLSIRVWGEDSLSANVIVRPDGIISLPGIGSIPAEGLTTDRLQASIAARLRDLVHEPMVSVAVHAFPNNCMVVHGPGTRSAVLPLTGKITLLQVLSTIQPDNNADLKNAYIERDGKRVTADFENLFKNGDGRNSGFEVLAGDRLFIPLREARLIFVEGAVGKPSSIPYHEGMTVLEAIHLAGGFTKFANRNCITITRKTEGGTESLQARLHDFTTKGDFSQNVPIQGGDIIFVKTSWF